MPTPAYDRTIDWDEYWAGDAGTAAADGGPSAEYILEPLTAFLEARGAPDSYADVGCGPGDVVFALADRYPDAPIVGYDAARPVLERNRARAAETGKENLWFERAVLPAFEPGRSFEVVSAFFTLCYVEEIELALERLYAAVEPGGALVFTYHNRYARAVYRRIAADPTAYLDDDSPWDPATFTERFELVLEGANLLSYDRIHATLGTWPQSVWSLAEGVERYPAWRHNPLVYVPK